MEAMTCAILGQEREDHKMRQNQALRQKHHRLVSPRDVDDASTQKARAGKAPQLDGTEKGHRQSMASAGDLPPLAGTPLHLAATASWADTAHRKGHCVVRDIRRNNSCAVVLDGNRASAKIVLGQGGLAGLGEAALFRGCALPETVVADKSWAPDSFWIKTGRTSIERFGRGD